MSLRDIFDRAEAILLSLGDLESSYTTIDTSTAGARVNVWPSEKMRPAAVQALLRFAGKITKGTNGEVQATRDGVTVILFDVLLCEKVGTKIVERPVMKATGEVETIEQPIYKCRLPFEEADAE